MKREKKVGIASFIRKKGMCQASDVMQKFSLSKPSVIKYLKEVGVLTSFNSKGQYYILPQHHLFDEDGLLFIGDVGFYEGGNLLAAICHLVKRSSQGLGARELDRALKTTTHSQLPNLFRTGRLQRESAINRAGNAYVYFSSDTARSQVQKDAYFNPPEELKELKEEELAPSELPDVIEVLLTLLAHPDFSAKSIALSLQRRGRKITNSFTMRVFQAYGLSKKTS
jgi:hypothetical protein